MLSRLPAVSGELITRDCRTMLRRSRLRPTCTWLPAVSGRDGVAAAFRAKRGGFWRFDSAGGGCEAIPTSSFVRSRPRLWQGQFSWVGKTEYAFSRVAFAFLWNLHPPPASRNYCSCTTKMLYSSERARTPYLHQLGKRKKACAQKEGQKRAMQKLNVERAVKANNPFKWLQKNQRNGKRLPNPPQDLE